MKLRCVAALAVLALSWGAGSAWAQQAYTSTTAPPLVVRLTVVAAPGVPATVALRNGEMGRWTRDDGSQYGLTPVVTNGSAQLLVFSITPGKTEGTERMEQLATLMLAPNKPAVFPASNPVFRVTMLGTTPVPAIVPEPVSPDGPCTTCCVTCGEWTVCACAVQMECGSCCCKDHCTCFGDVSQAGGCAAPLAGRVPSGA